MLNSTEQRLFDAICSRNPGHVEIVTVEVTGARKAPTICVYIDTPEGVTFDEITEAQKWINALMDELDPFPGAYTLEVSSPGIDRPLRTPEHFARFVGSRAYVKAKEAIDGRSAWTGVITAADAEQVTLDVDGVVYTVPFDKIKKANLKGEVTFS